MKTIRFVLVVVLTAVAVTQARATEKRVVAVNFRIEASSYRAHFDNTASLEIQVEEDLVKALQQNVRFLDFAPSSSASPAYTLTVSLAVPDPAIEVATQRVMLYSLLTAPDGTPVGSKWQWLKYRDALTECTDTSDSHCRLPEPREFTSELHLLFFSSGIYEDLVKNVLSQVSIGESGKFVSDPDGWVLPFRQADICMDKLSMLRIMNDIPTSRGNIPGQFLAQLIDPRPDSAESVFTLLIKPDPDTESVKVPLLKQSADRTVVKDVYVVTYHRLDDGTCGGAIPPGSTPSSGGTQ